MWNSPNILHESVADVLTDLGVKKGTGGRTNPPNNAAPKLVVEMHEGVPHECKCNGKGTCDYCKKMKKKKTDEAVSEAEKEKKTGKGKGVLHDETDGEPDTTTTVQMATDPDVNAEEANTEVNAEGELSREEQIAETFYSSLEKHIVIVYEGDDWDNAEVFGLTESDVAPCGGTPPAITAKYRNAAKEAKTRIDGKGYDALMLHASKSFGSGGNDVIGGTILASVGWKAPERGKGRKVSSGNKGEGKLADKGRT